MLPNVSKDINFWINSSFNVSKYCLSGREMAPTGQRPLLKDILGTRMLIMWEEQLVDPPIAYIMAEMDAEKMMENHGKIMITMTNFLLFFIQ